MIKPFLYVKNTASKGRGVFTRKKIEANVIIEESPVIVMSAIDRTLLDKTLLHDYIFEWGTHKNGCCMALGYISVYNHSNKSNCEYYMDFDQETIQVKTIRPVMQGEELTINYNGTWNDSKLVWFETS
jgi:uncharacterized protein